MTAPTLNGDGGQTRDFTFVENCVQANIRAALTTNPEALGQVYNIAVGDRTSLVQMYDILREEAGSDAGTEVRARPRRGHPRLAGRHLQGQHVCWATSRRCASARACRKRWSGLKPTRSSSSERN
jgi:nucleoside-diphosphate-sugar epimerase